MRPLSLSRLVHLSRVDYQHALWFKSYKVDGIIKKMVCFNEMDYQLSNLELKLTNFD